MVTSPSQSSRSPARLRRSKPRSTPRRSAKASGRRSSWISDASVDAPTRKAELEWEEDSDGDYKHYRAYAADEAFHPYYWLCASAANPKLYGVSIVDEDDDLIIIDERTSPVTLAQAMQIAEAHHRKANS